MDIRNFTEPPEIMPCRRSLDDRPRKPAFTAKVVVELDFDLANTLGNFLLDRKCENPALQALAWQLVGSD